MSEKTKHTPQEIVDEAKRAAQSQSKEMIIQNGAVEISPMLGYLNSSEYDLFLKTFCDELIRLNREEKK